MKRVLLAVLSVFLLAAITGCGSQKQSGEIYNYGDPDQCVDYHITRSIYTEDALKIYLKADDFIGEDDPKIDWIETRNSNFETIDGDAFFDYRKGVLSIFSKDPKQISGVEIHFAYGFGVKLRYLDSEQFAGISIWFLDDVGEEEYGDREAYYTEEERARQQAREEKRETESLEAFHMLEGHWESSSTDCYMDIYEGFGNYEVLIHQIEGEEYSDLDAYIVEFQSDYIEEDGIWEIAGSTGPDTALIYFTLDAVSNRMTISLVEDEFVRGN